MRVQLKRHGDEGAAALIVALVTSVVLLGVAAWVTDFGYAYSNKRVLQNGVDAAALAAAERIKDNAPAGVSCADLRTAVLAELDGAWNPADPGTAKQAASTIFRSNAVNTKAGLAASGGFSVSCDPTLGMLVSVTATQASDAFLGGALGVDALHLAASATAVVGTATAVIGLRPIAICQARALEAAAHPDAVYAFPLEDKADPVCGLDNSVWGLLNFEGSRGNPGQVHDILYGFEKSVGSSSPGHEVWIDGTPGIRTSLEDDLVTLVGKEVVFPVYDSYESHGKDFRITGFMTVEVCGVETNKATNIVAPCAAKGTGEWLMFVHKRFTPLADLNKGCVFGATGCDTGARVVKLAR